MVLQIHSSKHTQISLELLHKPWRIPKKDIAEECKPLVQGNEHHATIKDGQSKNSEQKGKSVLK